LGRTPLRPGSKHGTGGLTHVEPLRIEAPEVLVVEDEAYARFAVNPERVGGAETDVVVLENEAGPRVLGQGAPSFDPTRCARTAVAVAAADMDHDDGLVPEFHAVEDLGLTGDIGDALADQHRVGAVQDHILRGVEGKPQVEFAGLASDCSEVGIGVPHHGVELRHVRVGRVGREVRRHAVHADIVPHQIVEDLVEILERGSEVRVLLPSARVVALEIRPAHDLDREAETQRTDRRGPGARSCLTWAVNAYRRELLRSRRVLRSRDNADCQRAQPTRADSVHQVMRAG
jgi:hypothetical protein